MSDQPNILLFISDQQRTDDRQRKPHRRRKLFETLRITRSDGSAKHTLHNGPKCENQGASRSTAQHAQQCQGR